VTPMRSGSSTVATRVRWPKLADHGWKIGTVTNAPDQSMKSSCVDFTPGHSQAASIIAKQLGIHNVIPPTDDILTVAGPDADVIVVVGAYQPD
jgi:hypothetical protein